MISSSLSEVLTSAHPSENLLNAVQTWETMLSEDTLQKHVKKTVFLLAGILLDPHFHVDKILKKA